jgi:hypothetical protein
MCEKSPSEEQYLKTEKTFHITCGITEITHIRKGFFCFNSVLQVILAFSF